jgi:hypothetical protein
MFDEVKRVFVDIIQSVGPPSLASPQSFTCRTSSISTSSFRRTSAPTMTKFTWGDHIYRFDPWSPTYALAPVILLSISIPLAILAAFTTSVAFFLLFCRAFVVYIEFTVALVGTWFDPTSAKKSPSLYRSPPSSSPTQLSPIRHRQLHSSIGSSSSFPDAIVPSARPGRLDISSGMTPLDTTEVPRDYEGVGGWRTPGNGDEEAPWMGMNSRLQLPGDTPARRHQRSRSGGSSPIQRRTWSPEASRTNLLHGRVKTPVRFAIEDEGGYFPPQPMTSIRQSSDVVNSSKSHKRRKSGSSSSSSGLMMADKAGV